MACDLTKGKATPCKDSIGGIEAVYFMNYDDLGAITYDGTDTDMISTIAGTANIYKYDLTPIDAATFSQNIMSDDNTGNTHIEEILELTLPGLTKEDHKEIKLIAYGRPRVIVRNKIGNFFLMGTKFGASVTGGTIVMGGAMADLSGYTLSLRAVEPVPANYFNDTTEAALFANCGLTTVTS